MKKLLVALLAMAFIGSGEAVAHQPVTLLKTDTTAARGPLLVDGTVSFAVRAAFTKSGEKKAFRAQLQDGDALAVQYLIVDKRPENRLKTAQLPTVVITGPAGFKATIVVNERTKFFEPYGRTNYLYLARYNGVAKAGIYNFVITAKSKSAVVIAVGEKEILGEVVRGAAPTPTPTLAAVERQRLAAEAAAAEAAAAEVARLAEVERQRLAAEAAAAEAAAAEVARLAEVERQRLAEAASAAAEVARLAEVERQRLAEAASAAAAEVARLAEVERQRVAAAEVARLAEVERQRLAAAEVARLAEVERQRVAAEAAAAVAGYTTAQVRANNTASSCWAIVDGFVYNLTGWITSHPGGSGAIISLCGSDASAMFRAVHQQQQNPNRTLDSFLLGPLRG